MLSNSPDKRNNLNSSSDDLLDEKPLITQPPTFKLTPCKKAEHAKKLEESGFES